MWKEQKATIVYYKAGEVPLGLTPPVPSGCEAPGAALIYTQGGKRWVARYGRTLEGAYRLEYVREVQS